MRAHLIRLEVGLTMVGVVCLLLTHDANANESPVVDSFALEDEGVAEQLDRDSTLVPMGKGAVYVPYLVDPQNEPGYAIFRDDDLVADAKPGRRTPLNPGQYTLYIGSGPLDLRQRFTVDIVEERVSVVLPTWSALTVKTTDINNNPLRIGYQIFSEMTKIFIGAGVGVDEIMGEKPIIWLLKPDLYKVTKRGESPDSFRNFVNVRTQEGKASVVRLYFDEITEQFTGGGEVYDDETESSQRGQWSFNASLAGNFSFINEGFFDSDESDINNYSMRTTLNWRVTYEHENFLFINRLYVFENFQKPDGERLRFNQDLLQYESALIYRISRLFGPYVSFRLRTGMFNHYFRASTEETVDTYVLNGTIGDSAAMRNRLQPGEEFRYSGPFSPISMTESAGVNFDYRYLNILTTNIRAGWGFKQDVSRNLYDITVNERDVYDSNDYRTGRKEKLIPKIPDLQYSYGPEFVLMLTLMPLSFVEVKQSFEALIPVNDFQNINYFGTSTISLWLSNFASLQYEFMLERNPAISQAIKKIQSVTIQLYYRLL